MKNMKKLFAVVVLFSLFLPQMVFASARGPKLCGNFDVECDIKKGVKISGEDGVIAKLINCDYSDCEKYSVDLANSLSIIINKAYRARDAGNINIDWENLTRSENLNIGNITLDYLFIHTPTQYDENVTSGPENSIFRKKGNGPIFTTSGDCESCTLTVKNFDVEFNLEDQNQFSNGGGFTCGVTVGPGNITLSGVSIKASKSENSNPYAICGMDKKGVKIPNLQYVNAENVKGMLLGFRAPEVVIPQVKSSTLQFIYAFKEDEGFNLASLDSFLVTLGSDPENMNFTHLYHQLFSSPDKQEYNSGLEPTSPIFIASFEKIETTRSADGATDTRTITRKDIIFVTDFSKAAALPNVDASKMTDQKNIAVERLSPDALVINTSRIPYKEANVVVDPEPGDGDDKEDGKDEDEGEDKKDGSGGQGAPLESGGDGGVTPQGDGGENPVDYGGSCTLINSVNGAVYASLITLLLVMMPSILMRLSAVRSRKK